MPRGDSSVDEPHSASQIGPHRESWWNLDFVELIAERYQLRTCRSLIDLGSGQGHWARILARFLASEAIVVGVDTARPWLDKARVRWAEAFPEWSKRLAVVEADAEILPVRSNSFDMATCQTLLIHLASPEAAVREMVRVVRPGGLVLCAEPNNLWNYVRPTSLTGRRSIASLVREYEFWLRFVRGRKESGYGDMTLGDALPGLLHDAGLMDIRVIRSDKAFSFIPGRGSNEELEWLAQRTRWHDLGQGPWDRAFIDRAVEATGATQALIDEAWETLEAAYRDESAAIEQGTFSAAGGGMVYVISGSKPSHSDEVGAQGRS